MLEMIDFIFQWFKTLYFLRDKVEVLGKTRDQYIKVSEFTRRVGIEISIAVGKGLFK